MKAEGPRRSGAGGTDPWVVTIVAAIVVVAGGWFLGQALAHVFGGNSNSDAQATPAPVAVVTATPQPSAQASAKASPTATPTSKPAVRPAVKATHNPTRPSATPAPTATPVPTATATAAPTSAPTAAPTAEPTARATPRPTHTPTPAPVRTMIPRPTIAPQISAENIGTQTVRAYINALRHGDPQAAAGYLGNGVPDEDFIDAQTRITTLTSTRESDGSYKIAVNMQTSRGAYSETFVVAPAGTSARILEKTAVKP